MFRKYEQIDYAKKCMQVNYTKSYVYKWIEMEGCKAIYA